MKRLDNSFTGSSRCPVDQLPWFVNGTLAGEKRAAVAAHVAQCAGCRSEMAAWSELRRTIHAAGAATPSPGAARFTAIEQQIAAQRVPPRRLELRPLLDGFLLTLQACVDHFAAQTRLILRDLFVLPLLLVPLVGWIVYLHASRQQGPELPALFATLLTALGMAFLYGQEVDPARELVLATPTSPRLVLGVRCCVVFGYHMLLNCGLVLPFLVWLGIITPGWFMVNWLAPLCCLAAIALLLAILSNSTTAVAVCAVLWGLRLLARMDLLREVPWPRMYELFWHQAPVLFGVAALAALLAFGLLEHKERFV